jgi:hypothetical protein
MAEHFFVDFELMLILVQQPKLDFMEFVKQHWQFEFGLVEGPD